MMTKLASKARPIRLKSLKCSIISPWGAFEGDREHVDHNEQVTQQIDVFWNLFHISS